MDELPADDSIAKGRAVKKIGSHGTPTDFGVAVRKSDTELLKIINEGTPEEVPQQVGFFPPFFPNRRLHAGGSRNGMPCSLF